MLKNSLSKTLQTKIDLAIKSKDMITCSHLSYDVFSQDQFTPILGSLGHSIDLQFQQSPVFGTLIDTFSSEYPNVLSPHYVNQLINDPNYRNFSNSNQQFTMLTEAVIAHKMALIFPDVADKCNLLMGAKIPNYLSRMVAFHNGQHNVDFVIEKKLPSGAILVTYNDLKRTAMQVVESKVGSYMLHCNKGSLSSKKPIYSNVHVTTDIDSQYIVSPYLYDFLKNQLKDTKNFYALNRKYYTVKEYDAIDEAITQSVPFESEFLNTGKVYPFNKILYNAAKFMTSDEMCKLLGISKLF